MNLSSIICVIFSCLFAFTQAVFDQKQILELTSKCNGTPEDTQVTLQYKVPDTPSGKCLIHCMIKELNMLTAQDKYDEVSALAALRKYWSEIKDAKLLDVHTNCAALAKKIPSDTPACEYGYQIMKCINSEFTKGGLFNETLKIPKN